jgi:colicin import membrane protein
MNSAAPGGVPYRVPPEPSRWGSLTLALVVHAGLLLFLWAGVSWQSTPPVAVEAEVWDMKVQQAAPPPPAPEPVSEPEVAPPPPPPKAVERPPEVEATPTPPDIALEKARLRAEKLKELEREKKLAEQKRLEEKRLADEKAKKLEEKKKLDQEKKKELAEKKKREAEEKLAKAKADAAAKKAREDLRKAEMQRMMAQASGTSGTAAKSTAPRMDSGYIAGITAKIKANTTFLGSTDLPGNPRAQFRVEQLPTGEIISVRMTKSSGVPSFDDAVEKGIIKSSPLPKKKDGTVERTLAIGFSMKDLD